MLRKLFLLSILSLFGKVSLADQTMSDIIGSLRLNDEETIFFEPERKSWYVVSDTCSPRYVRVDSSVKGRKEILAIALAAKLAKKKVYFYGECDKDTGRYFHTSSIVMK